MKNIIVFFVIGLLFSCGGGNTNNAVKPNSISLQILKLTSFEPRTGTPLKGVLVQLDHDGIVLKSNEQGYVTFDAISNGEHDVHAFPADYSWTSVYNIKVGELVPVYVGYPYFYTTDQNPVTGISYLTFSGSITEKLPDTYLDFDFYINENESGEITSKILNKNTAGNSYSIDIEFLAPVGTTITGSLIAHERKNNGANNVDTIIDSDIIQVSALNTNLNVGNSITQNFVFSKIKPTASNLVSFNNINIPTGLTISDLGINSASKLGNNIPTKSWVNYYILRNYKNTNGFNLTDPNTFQSYDIFNVKDLIFFIDANTNPPNINILWSYFSKYQKGMSNINTKFISIPKIAKNQTGELLVWSDVDKNVNTGSILISTKYFKNWRLWVDPKIGKLRLPEIPANVIPILTKGQNYRVQLFAGISSGESAESYAISDDSWVR